MSKSSSWICELIGIYKQTKKDDTKCTKFLNDSEHAKFRVLIIENRYSVFSALLISDKRWLESSMWADEIKKRREDWLISCFRHVSLFEITGSHTMKRHVCA